MTESVPRIIYSVCSNCGINKENEACTCDLSIEASNLVSDSFEKKIASTQLVTCPICRTSETIDDNDELAITFDPCDECRILHCDACMDRIDLFEVECPFSDHHDDSYYCLDCITIVTSRYLNSVLHKRNERKSIHSELIKRG